MAYNHGREERKWRIWKENEERILRECGVDENTIDKIRTYDRADLSIAYGGKAHPAYSPAENAGIFHKGDCPDCRFNNGSDLCKVGTLAEKAEENFIGF